MAETLDATGLKCPLPVLRARKALKSVESGAALEVLATDPAAVKDFQAFCAETGHRFIGFTQDDEVFHITVEKAG